MEPAGSRRDYRAELPLILAGPLLIAVGSEFASIFVIMAGVVFSICAIKRPPKLVYYWTCFECGDEVPGPSVDVRDPSLSP